MAREEVLGLVFHFHKPAQLCYLEKHSLWAPEPLSTESKVMGLEREILKVSC